MKNVFKNMTKCGRVTEMKPNEPNRVKMKVVRL